MKNLFIKSGYLFVAGVLLGSCNNNPQVKIIDLKDALGDPLGTKVRFGIPMI